MKTLIMLTIATLLFIAQSCTEENDVTPNTEKVNFAFSLPDQEDNGGKKTSSTDLPAGTSLVLSIVTSTGQSVIDHQKIELLKIGDEFISQPIDLPPGHYKLTDFFLVNESSEVLFATPRSGSPLASAVAHPLPYGFFVQKNAIRNVTMEVINAALHSPADFGYVAFGVNVVNPLMLTVFIEKSGGLAFSSATAYIMKDRVTLRTYSLKAQINRIAFREDPAATYTLVVIRDGYSRFALNFNYNDLSEELGNAPLKVILKPAFTMVAYGGGYRITMISNSESSIKVDWGDGASTDYAITAGADSDLTHMYSVPGTYFVSVTGDIDKLVDFHCYYNEAIIRRINFEHLPELSGIGYGVIWDGPTVIDLSHNTKLAVIRIGGINQMKVLTLPSQNQIGYLTINKPNSLPISSINAAIHVVYLSVLQDGRSGYMVIDVKPNLVTDQALMEVQRLRNEFGWDITLDPTDGGG
jgi:hypothetical protein